MTEQMCMLEELYSVEWNNSVQIEHYPLNICLPEAESTSPTTASHNFFHPSDVPPISSTRRSTLDHIVSRLSASTLPGNEYVIALAKKLDRTSSAVSMKLCNFASFDPIHQARGVSGLAHAAKGDKETFITQCPTRLLV